ncbi:MAG: hypothetical protein ACMXYL_03635 [Candidatus Woesearchaeota archaeon]
MEQDNSNKRWSIVARLCEGTAVVSGLASITGMSTALFGGPESSLYTPAAYTAGIGFGTFVLSSIGALYYNARIKADNYSADSTYHTLQGKHYNETRDEDLMRLVGDYREDSLRARLYSWDK